MIYDTDAHPLSADEIEAVRQNARQRLALWKRRGIYSTVIFFVSCACVFPFLEGHFLHTYWDSFGKYLILVSLALLLVFVYCTSLWWGAWRALKDVEKV